MIVDSRQKCMIHLSWKKKNREEEVFVGINGNGREKCLKQAKMTKSFSLI